MGKVKHNGGGGDEVYTGRKWNNDKSVLATHCILECTVHTK